MKKLMAVNVQVKDRSYRLMEKLLCDRKAKIMYNTRYERRVLF
jgi:hypothetical protein